MKKGIHTTEFYVTAAAIVAGSLSTILAPVSATVAAALGTASAIAYVISRTIVKVAHAKAGNIETKP